jgi:hypothetical protein
MADHAATAAPSAAPPAVPGYVLQTLLGRGGSGEVWRAVPKRGGPAVAVKVLVDGDPEQQAREAALLGELDHPHLVRLVEVVHQPRRGGPARVALVLDLLEGGSLAALLARRGRLRPGEVVTAIAPVAAALAHAHAHGVVHGDLSPGNIVFTSDGRPVLTDLGVARVLGEAAAAEVTPPYVDPTVARGGAPGPASDVFGAAAAAFHALTGVAPWNAATPADTLAVASAGHLPDLRELAPEAPAELLAVVERGLAADPHDRGTAAAFALDLRHSCRPEPVRLPAAGAAEGLLDDPARGPRTEHTHQVPGRHRSAPSTGSAGVASVGASAGTSEGRAPAWARAGVRVLARVRARARASVGARSGARRPLGPVVALGLVAAALAAAGLAGVLRPSDGPATRETAGAVPATPPGPPSAAPAPPSAAPGSAADPPAEVEPPAPVDWPVVVTGLYEARATALEAASASGLDAVYAPGSPLLAADREHVSAMLAAGERLRGFAPEVVRVEPTSVTADRVVLAVVDRWPGYEVVAAGSPDGPAVGRGPARPETPVRMVLVDTPAGWRIESALRTA